LPAVFGRAVLLVIWAALLCDARARPHGSHANGYDLLRLYTWHQMLWCDLPSSACCCQQPLYPGSERLQHVTNTPPHILTPRLPAPPPPAPPNTHPAHQANWPAAPPGAGKSAPSRSIMSVCSLQLMRTSCTPAARASAATRLVLPTPGLPSRSTALPSCRTPHSRNHHTAQYTTQQNTPHNAPPHPAQQPSRTMGRYSQQGAFNNGRPLQGSHAQVVRGQPAGQQRDARVRESRSNILLHFRASYAAHAVPL
jgi:hypothetical protein